MNQELQAYFMQRWESMKKSSDSHPYAKWVAVIDPKCSPVCRELKGKVWRVDGKSLSDLVYSHIAQRYANCRCRLTPMSLESIVRERVQTMD